MRGLDRMSKRAELDGKRAEYLRRIDCEAVLEHYGAENVHRDGDELVHSCIIDHVDPHHAHGDATPSARLNVEKKVFNCWSYGGGDIFWLILQMERKDHFHEIAPLLSRFLGDAVVDTKSFIEEIENFFHKEATAPLPRYHEQALKGWSFYHPYLGTRGIDFETAERLQVGYDERMNRIVIPVWHNDQIVGWQKRSIPQGDEWPGTEPPKGTNHVPKYLNPPGFPKHQVLYNLNRVVERGERTVILVESPFSVIKAEALGIHNAVASFGASPSPEQLAQLRRFDKVLVWYDDDDAGYRGAALAIDGLLHYTNVILVSPDGNKDLGDYDTQSEALQWVSENQTPGVIAAGILNPKGARRGHHGRDKRPSRS